jgi:hypothetical protein
MAIDYRCCLNPALAQQGEASYILAHIAGRTLWHRLYDNLPTLEKSLGDQSTDVLLAFLADCERDGKSLDWRASLIFFEWLHRHRPDLIKNLSGNTLLMECLSAAGARWATDVIHVGSYRMMLGCKVSGLVVGVARSTAVDMPAKIYQLALDNGIPAGPRFQFSLSSLADTWSVDRWQAVFEAVFAD